ncbi:MAG: TauD/TfdA family dioxygenase [Tistlia sp.]|uniref:TauD/TfdA family dioxygenase n=1 Tax=Tistlia sp. TaxID=3057121 RepID=UPI0034A1F30B
MATQVRKGERALTVGWPDWPQATFHFIWLRDNCQCPACLHPSTRERTHFTADVPAGVTAAEAALTAEGDLRVRWAPSTLDPEGHESVFPDGFLRAFLYPAESGPLQAPPQRRLWAGELNGRVPSFDFAEVVRDDAALLGWCEAIRDVGLAVVHGLPNHNGEVERFVERVAFVRETVYDRLHEVFVDPKAYNVASTALELKPHTDMPNYAWPPSIQLLHFMRNEARGGETTAVDGFQVAERLREERPDCFDLLTHVQACWRMFSEKGDIVGRAPMITLDPEGRITLVRFSNQLMQPLQIAPELVEPFYEAYRILARMIEDPANQVVMRMSSGDLVTTHNHRVLHGRKAFDPASGARKLQLSYMDFDDLLSRIRLLSARRAVAA